MLALVAANAAGCLGLLAWSDALARATVWSAGLAGSALALAGLALLGRQAQRAEHALLDAAQADAELARQRLQDALEASPAGFELFDADDRLVLTNSAMREMYPRIVPLLDQQPTFEALVRFNHAAGGLPGLDGHFENWLADRLHALRTPGAPTLHEAEGGRWVRAQHRRLRDGSLVGVRIDVTEEVRQTAAAEAARVAAEQASHRLADAIEAMSDGFALYDADDRLVICNARYRAIYGELALVVTPGVSFETLLRQGAAIGMFPQARGRSEAWIAERLYRHLHPGTPLLQELPGNRWVSIDERRTRDGGVAGVRTDVTELVRREQDLRRLNSQLDEANLRLALLSETDALTGIANRRQFDRRLAEEVARATRHGLPLALLMLDVDHFKRYNDAHGHPAGDDCLRRVATALTVCARRPADLVARFGGEEFAILLPHTGPTGALTQARRGLQAVDAAAIDHADSPVSAFVTLSIGVATLPQAEAAAGEEAQALLNAADAALYRAKQAGRHCVTAA